MMNYTRVARLVDGVLAFSLIDDHGNAVQAFDIFVDCILREGLRLKTVETYSNHVASFLDFLTQAQVFGWPCSEVQMIDAIKKYLPARMAGGSADGKFNLISRQVLGQSKLTKASAKSHAAAINKFLFESDQYALHVRQIESWEVGASEKAPKQLFGANIRRRSKIEVSRIYQSSMMINVMKYHPIITAEKALIVRGKDNSNNLNKDFPPEYISWLLDNATCARDEALWALQAGTGLRSHEALLLEMGQIDFDNRTVAAVDPHNRRFASQLPTSYFKRWKGRALSETYFIPLLRDRFFNALERYFRTEYKPRVNDAIVFQLLKDDQKPYFEVSDKSRIQSFRRACLRVQNRIAEGAADLTSFTPHSLRHFYGTYMLNYAPVGPDSFGLRPVEVQRLMGHQNLETTMKYARQDKLALDAKLMFMNMHAMNGAPEADQLVKWIADKYSYHAERLNKSISARLEQDDQLDG